MNGDGRAGNNARKIDPARLRAWLLERLAAADGLPCPGNHTLAREAMDPMGPLRHVMSDSSGAAAVARTLYQLADDGMIVVEHRNAQARRVAVMRQSAAGGWAIDKRTDWSSVPSGGWKPRAAAPPPPRPDHDPAVARNASLDAIARAGLRGQIILPVDRLDQPSRRATDFCMPRGIGVTAAIADMRRRGVSDAAICHRLGLSPRSLVPERRGSEAW